MNRLSSDERAHLLQLLCEGMSIRAVSRATGASKNTILKLLNDAGRALGGYQDEVFVNLPCKRVQVDEIWSFTYAKQKNVPTAKAAPVECGDTWTWTAICADTKLVFSVLVGDRDAYFAKMFMQDVASRLSHRVQITSDGHKSYLRAVEDAFGADVDYAQLVKVYGQPAYSPGRYSPPRLLAATRVRVQGRPDMKHASTSYVERQNLTMRMHMRRFTRLTNGFSKKLENHANAIALHFAYYNFVRVHQSLRMTPAMAAGVTDRLWEMADLVAIVAAADAQPERPTTYKKKAAKAA
jgi:IS1 family transposase